MRFPPRRAAYGILMFDEIVRNRGENTLQNRQKSVLYLAITLLWFSIYVYVPTLSTYAEGLGASYTLIGTILSAYGFVQMLFRLPIGIAADLTGRRKAFMLGGLGAAMAAGASFYFFRDPALLVLCRALSGLCASTWAVYMICFGSLFSEEEQPRALGVASSAMFVGQVPATFLGGVTAQLWGERATFLVAVGAAALGMLLMTRVEQPRSTRTQRLSAQDFWQLLKNRDLWFYSLMAAFLQIALYAGGSGFASNLLKALGANNFLLGVGTTLSSLPAIFSSALSGSFFRERWGSRRSMLLAFVIVAVTLAAMGYVSMIWGVLLLLLVNGFAKGLLQSLLNSLAVMDVAPPLRSTGAAFFQSVYGIGMTLGPVLTGALADAHGMQYSLLAISALCLFPVLCIALKKQVR